MDRVNDLRAHSDEVAYASSLYDEDDMAEYVAMATEHAEREGQIEATDERNARMGTIFIEKEEYNGKVENLPEYFGTTNWVNDPAYRRAEMWSANTSASARGLAFLGTIMANRGVGADGKRYIPK